MKYHFGKMKLASRIKEIRKSKNLTQEAIAEKINIETPNYSKVENGKFAPSLSSLSRIVNALDVSYDEIMDCSHLEDENFLDENIKEIYSNYSLNQKRCLYKIMRAMQENS